MVPTDPEEYTDEDFERDLAEGAEPLRVGSRPDDVLAAPANEFPPPVELSGIARAPRAGDLKLAFSSFTARVNKASARLVPIDIQRNEVTFDVDADTRALKANARLSFRQIDAGMPLLNLLPDCTQATLDGVPIAVATAMPRMYLGPGSLTEPSFMTPSEFDTLSEPDKGDFQPVRLIAQRLSPGTHELSADYEPGRVTDSANSFELFLRVDRHVQALLGGHTSAVTSAGAYVPSNFQFDQVPLRLVFTLPVGADYVAFSNGAVRTLPGAAQQSLLEITFPPGMATSEFFLHLAAKASITELRTSYKSCDGRVIALTLYTNDGSLEASSRKAMLERAAATVASALVEFELLFGAYPFNAFVARLAAQAAVRDDGEALHFAGAAEATLETIRYQTLRRAFGRTFSASNAASGWVIEAVARWLDGGRKSAENRTTTRHSLRGPPEAVSTAGQTLLMDLDVDLRANGEPGAGVTAALQRVAHKFRGRAISNEQFVETVIGAATTTAQGLAARATFDRYGLTRRQG